MEITNQQLRKNGLNNGLILGVVSFVLGIFSFYFITTMTSSIWMILFGPVIFSIIIPLVLVIFLCIDLRKKIGGYWNFRQATSCIFIMFFVAYILQSVITSLVFAKLVEPNMVEKTQNAIMKATTSMLERSGADQATIDAKVADTQKEFDEQKNPTISKTIRGIAISIVVIFIVSMIFGAIFKREPLKSIQEPDIVEPSV